MKKLVVALDEKYVDDGYLEKIRRLASDYELVVSKDRETIRGFINEVEIAIGLYPLDLVRESPNLKWLQWWWAGVEWLSEHPEIVEKDMFITNSSGVHAVPMAEHCIGMMICLARNLHEDIQRQRRRIWDAKTMNDVSELEDKQALIVGLGSIGSHLAMLLSAFNMKIVGIKRNPENNIPHTERVVGTEALHKELPDADYVILILPATDKTEKIFGTEEFRLMKREAYLINLGRGATVSENALAEALREREIAGAALDTFETEPLSESSALWDFENVIISPHHSGYTPKYWKRIWPLIEENIVRFREGRPLRNLIDKKEGY